MMTIAWALLFVVASMAIDEWLTGRQNPNRDPPATLGSDGRRTVILKANAQHHYFAGARINGHPVTLLVDTGATDVVVSRAFAERLGLPHGTQSLAQTANGRVRVTRTVIDEITIGPIVLREVRASINPGMGSREPILLGMSALKNVELRQSGGELTLIQN
jgi:aspartyl protease family protein